jgi:hypothetical protein
MIKTRYRPQWLWSTFEHVDNVPSAGEGDAREPDAKDAGAPYSYFDPAQPGRRLPLLGSPESLPISMSNPPKVDPASMQVTRRHPIHPSTVALNRAYWALPGSKERSGSATCSSPASGRPSPIRADLRMMEPISPA